MSFYVRAFQVSYPKGQQKQKEKKNDQMRYSRNQVKPIQLQRTAHDQRNKTKTKKTVGQNTKKRQKREVQMLYNHKRERTHNALMCIAFVSALSSSSPEAPMVQSNANQQANQVIMKLTIKIKKKAHPCCLVAFHKKN